MKLPSVLICSSIALAVTTGAAQTISVDMDTGTDDIQEVVVAADTAETLTVAIRIANADNLFSYQCKVAFDPDHFIFLAAQQDFGISGEKNILTKNSGSVIGIYQLQTNPPAEDSIVISGSITGTDASLSVDGEGCIGVLYFVSKVAPGDTAAITVTQGYLAEYGEDLTPVEEYEDGVYTVDPSVHVTGREEWRRSHFSAAAVINMVIQFPDFSLGIAIPAAYANRSDNISIALYSLDGRMVTSHREPLRAAPRTIQVPISNNRDRNTAGNYLCTVKTGNYRYSRTVTIR